MPKKIILLALLIIFYTITHAQNASWMMGTWKSTSRTTIPSHIANTIQVNDVSGESFTGTKTSEITDGSQAKITFSISGFFQGKDLYLQNGEVLHKEGAQNAQWDDCSACTQVNKMIISRDSLILVNSISGCNNRCDAVTYYYRLLSEYDSSTQRHLLDRFGRPSDIIGFRPFRPLKDETVVSNDNTESSKNDVVTGVVINNEKRQQQTDGSIRLAQQKKRQQEIADSLNLVQQRNQQRINDSLNNIAMLEQIRKRTEDSLRDVQAKKRQQEIADSINLAQQQKQQRIKDSLDNIARIKQQQTDDLARLAQQKKRELEIADSLNLVQQREQQHLKDSLNNVALLEQIRKRTEDSLQNVQMKKRQQEIADSLNLVQQKEQQRLNDSLQNATAANLQKQRTADSLNDVQARKRQQEITDSLVAVRRQQYNDSLQKAALVKNVQPTADSTSSTANKALTSRTNVLLGAYHITSPDILIELFDNGEIDGDRVSVYHNDTIIVSNQMLGTKPITLNIHADTTHREHEFVLVAENLGSIPPNSALMRITAGKQIYKLSVNTDMKTNARIVFYYDGN